MRDARSVQRDADHILFGLLDPFADRFGHFTGLAQTGTDEAIAVANHHHRAETETTAALDDLRNSVNSDDTLFELGVHSFDSRHTSLLKLQATGACAIGDSLDAAVVQVPASIEDH
jgi:hypothetical protein